MCIVQGMIERHSESFARLVINLLLRPIGAYSKYVGAMSAVFQLGQEAQSSPKYYSW